MHGNGGALRTIPLLLLEVGISCLLTFSRALKFVGSRPCANVSNRHMHGGSAPEVMTVLMRLLFHPTIFKVQRFLKFWRRTNRYSM